MTPMLLEPPAEGGTKVDSTEELASCPLEFAGNVLFQSPQDVLKAAL